jgi:2'-5' RNA ligase
VAEADSTFVPKHGVVSLLDPGSSERVRRVWSRLETKFGLRGVLIMPYPHFSYQIAAGYGREAIEARLRTVARDLPPFRVATTGLGQFDGPWPVVFIAVERTALLQSIHEKVWNACLPLSTAPVQYYRPEVWVPHVTLAHGEERNSVPLSGEVVAKIRNELQSEDFRWELPIDNLTLVWDERTIQRTVASFQLEGSGAGVPNGRYSAGTHG